MFLAPIFLRGELPEILESIYKIDTGSDHVVKFRGDRQRELGDLAAKKKKKHHEHFITVRRSALHGLCDGNSICLSVRPSVRPSVTLVDCVHVVRPTIMIPSPYGSPIILVTGDITFIPKFEGGYPE